MHCTARQQFISLYKLSLTSSSLTLMTLATSLPRFHFTYHMQFTRCSDCRRIAHSQPLWRVYFQNSPSVIRESQVTANLSSHTAGIADDVSAYWRHGSLKRFLFNPGDTFQSGGFGVLKRMPFRKEGLKKEVAI